MEVLTDIATDNLVGHDVGPNLYVGFSHLPHALQDQYQRAVRGLRRELSRQ